MESNKTISKPSAAKNYIYNLIYQIVVIIVPLITTPYISRVLGSDGVGAYSFTYSITTYFVLIGALGFGYYAQREIARHQNDKKSQTLIFWEIQICKAVSVGVALAIDLTLIFFNVYGDYSLLMNLLVINIVATFFDVAFIFQGNENFKQIVLRNIFFKIVGVIAIFVFVKKETDLWIYTLAQCVILIVSNISLWVSLPKYLTKISVKELNFKRHLLPSLRLFIPTIAVMIYTVLDRTLIGIMVPGTITSYDEAGKETITKISDIENGYYDQSERIVKLCLTIVTALGTVMIPKNSYYFEKGDFETVRYNVYKAIQFVFFLGCPIMFGLAAVASNFSPWFFGDGYEKVPCLIMIFSPLILTIGLNNAFGIQYLLPAGKDNVYTFSVVIGSCVNLVLNLIFIPLLMSVGAAIASVIAEMSILAFQCVYLRKVFSIKKILLSGIKYVLFGGIMFGVVYPISYFFFSPSILNTIILVSIGIAVYFIILLAFKDQFLFDIFSKINSVLTKIKRR